MSISKFSPAIRRLADDHLQKYLAYHDVLGREHTDDEADAAADPLSDAFFALVTAPAVTPLDLAVQARGTFLAFSRRWRPGSRAPALIAGRKGGITYPRIVHLREGNPV